MSGAANMADGSIFTGKNKADNRKKPRIAFTGEEYGFGYQAVGNLVGRAKREGIADGGASAVARMRTERELSVHASSADKFCFSDTQRQPLRTKEQALMAVKAGSADYAVVPFYSPYSGYDFETMRAMANLSQLRGVDQVEANDQLCLAVHESQVLEIAQSAHPNSSLSALLANGRTKWGSNSNREDIFNYDSEHGGEMNRSGLVINQSTQMILRDRLEMVYGDTDATLRCKSKLDGLRGAGVEFREMRDTVEPHREFARMSRSTLNPDRMVNTYFNPSTGDAHYVSAMNGAAQTKGLYGVILPFEVADRSSEYIIIDPDMEDSEPGKTRFMVVQSNVDHTLFDDAYRTTDAKTRYWVRRARAVAHSMSGLEEEGGVRVLMRFRRDGSAASIGDVENFLRNYGVRHTVVRMDEDSEGSTPAPVILDVEFTADDFEYNPATMFSRRLRGSVVNGAMKKAFQRWKNRGVSIMAVMPYDKAQLPRHKPRRWWNEAFVAWAKDFGETMFIRLSRVLFYLMLVALVGAALYIWRTMM